MAQQTLKQLFDKIVDAIHDKDGLSDGISAKDFPDRIKAIPTGVTVSSIAVIAPPDKTTYSVGDIFDPTGMTVLATFSDNSTILIGVSNITFSPSGPLTITNESITVSFTFGNKTVNTQQLITVMDVAIYGVEWDGSTTTKWTRTDAASKFIDPIPYVAGATVYRSPFDTLYPWSDMIVENRIGGSMVKIPKFWYKLTKNGNGLKIQIVGEAMEGFYVSPAHMDRGDGKGERDAVYIGRYHCGNNFKSNSGQTPKSGITRSEFRTSIHNLGINIWQADFAMRFTLWLLYLVEFADWNSQATIGKGFGDNNAPQNMGYTDYMPYHTGTTQSNRDTYGLGTQYRNIEGLWDNVHDWCDGCYNASNGLNIILNPNNFSDTSGGVSVGTPTNGYPSLLNVVNQSGFPMFIPSASNGGANAGICDYWGFDTRNPVIFVGGYYGQYDHRGLFYVGGTDTMYTGDIVGSRIQELP